MLVTQKSLYKHFPYQITDNEKVSKYTMIIMYYSANIDLHVLS